MDAPDGTDRELRKAFAQLQSEHQVTQFLLIRLLFELQQISNDFETVVHNVFDETANLIESASFSPVDEAGTQSFALELVEKLRGAVVRDQPLKQDE